GLGRRRKIVKERKTLFEVVGFFLLIGEPNVYRNSQSVLRSTLICGRRHRSDSVVDDFAFVNQVAACIYKIQIRLILNQILQPLRESTLNSRFYQRCVVLKVIDLERVGIDFARTSEIIHRARRQPANNRNKEESK